MVLSWKLKHFLRKHLSRIVLILSNICDPSHINADFLRHHISALQKRNYIVGEKLKDNELEQFLCSPFVFGKYVP